MGKSEKLLNFIQELMRLLSKYKFTLWSCGCCLSIAVKDYNGKTIADGLDIVHKENMLQYDLYDYQTDSYVRGEYYEKSKTMD